MAEVFRLLLLLLLEQDRTGGSREEVRLGAVRSSTRAWMPVPVRSRRRLLPAFNRAPRDEVRSGALRAHSGFSHCSSGLGTRCLRRSPSRRAFSPLEVVRSGALRDLFVFVRMHAC